MRRGSLVVLAVALALAGCGPGILVAIGAGAGAGIGLSGGGSSHGGGAGDLGAWRVSYAPSSRLAAIAVDWNDPSRVYVALESGSVARSTDSGVSWGPPAPVDSAATPTCIFAAGGVFLGTDAGVWASNDFKTWFLPTSSFSTLALAAWRAGVPDGGVSGATLLAGTDHGVRTSYDGGRSWWGPDGAHAVRALDAANHYALGVGWDGLAYDRYDSTIYEAWQVQGTAAVTSFPPGGSLVAVATNESWAYLGSTYALYRARAAQLRAYSLVTPPDRWGRLRQLATGAGSSDVLWALTEEGKVFRSTDAGVNWYAAAQRLPAIRAIALDIKNPSVAFALSPEAVYVTRSGGD